MIVVNFKTYPQATGEKAAALAQICKRVGGETGVRIIVVPQVADLAACVATGVDCWVQHIDPVEPGKHTGYTVLEEVAAAGAKGTLLNHSEHKMDYSDIQTVVSRARRAGPFTVCLCAADVAEARHLDQLNPDLIAYEPVELIGSKDKSVSSQKPDVIARVVREVRAPVLIGAGVHSARDVQVGQELGAKGILLATDIVLADDPEGELRELALVFRKRPIGRS